MAEGGAVLSVFPLYLYFFDNQSLRIQERCPCLFHTVLFGESYRPPL